MEIHNKAESLTYWPLEEDTVPLYSLAHFSYLTCLIEMEGKRL